MMKRKYLLVVFILFLILGHVQVGGAQPGQTPRGWRAGVPKPPPGYRIVPPGEEDRKDAATDRSAADEARWEAWAKEIRAKNQAEEAKRGAEEKAKGEANAIGLGEKPAAIDTTTIIILPIIVLLAVVCIILYFKPQLTAWGSQKPKPERSEPIEKQEEEVSEPHVEGKEDNLVNRMINRKASAATKMVLGFLMLLLFTASLAMAWGWLGGKSEKKLKEARDYQEKQLQLQQEQKRFQDNQAKMLEDIKKEQDKIKRNQEILGRNQRRIIREQNEPHFVIPLH